MKTKIFLKRILFAGIFVAFGLSSIVKAENNMSEAPFWMSSYDEFNDLQEAQKKFYLEKLEVELVKIPALKKTTGKDLKDAAEWYQSWDHIRRKVYASCHDKDLLKVCEKVADVRLKTLELSGNQSEKNRKAAE